MLKEALKKERIQLFKTATTGKKKPDRVPIFSNMWSWKIFDAGYQLSEALNDYEILKKLYVIFMKITRQMFAMKPVGVILFKLRKVWVMMPTSLMMNRILSALKTNVI